MVESCYLSVDTIYFSWPFHLSGGLYGPSRDCSSPRPIDVECFFLGGLIIMLLGLRFYSWSIVIPGSMLIPPSMDIISRERDQSAPCELPSPELLFYSARWCCRLVYGSLDPLIHFSLAPLLPWPLDILVHDNCMYRLWIIINVLIDVFHQLSQLVGWLNVILETFDIIVNLTLWSFFLWLHCD